MTATTTLPRWTAAANIAGELVPVDGNPTSDTLDALRKAVARQMFDLLEVGEDVEVVVYKRLAGKEPVRDRSYRMTREPNAIATLYMGA